MSPGGDKSDVVVGKHRKKEGVKLKRETEGKERSRRWKEREKDKDDGKPQKGMDVM